MAQATILAAATTAGTSTDVALATGVFARVGVFATSASIPTDLQCPVMIDTPGDDAVFGVLTAFEPTLLIRGPGTFRVKRPVVEAGVAVGVFSET